MLRRSSRAGGAPLRWLPGRSAVRSVPSACSSALIGVAWPASDERDGRPRDGIRGFSRAGYRRTVAAMRPVLVPRWVSAASAATSVMADRGAGPTRCAIRADPGELTPCHPPRVRDCAPARHAQHALSCISSKLYNDSCRYFSEKWRCATAANNRIRHRCVDGLGDPGWQICQPCAGSY